jgi:hypothetical protein
VKVYIIQGSVGDYEDRYEFIEKAFIDKQKAEKHLEQLKLERLVFYAWVRDIFSDYKNLLYEKADINDEWDEDDDLVNNFWNENICKILTLGQCNFTEYEFPIYHMIEIDVVE